MSDDLHIKGPTYAWQKWILIVIGMIVMLCTWIVNLLWEDD
jgi:hypothetical protein